MVHRRYEGSLTNVSVVCVSFQRVFFFENTKNIPERTLRLALRTSSGDGRRRRFEKFRYVSEFGEKKIESARLMQLV